MNNIGWSVATQKTAQCSSSLIWVNKPSLDLFSSLSAKWKALNNLWHAVWWRALMRTSLLEIRNRRCIHTCIRVTAVFRSKIKPNFPYQVLTWYPLDWDVICLGCWLSPVLVGHTVVVQSHDHSSAQWLYVFLCLLAVKCLCSVCSQLFCYSYSRFELWWKSGC